MYMDMDSILHSEKVLIFISYALSSVIKHSNHGNRRNWFNSHEGYIPADFSTTNNASMYIISIINI